VAQDGDALNYAREEVLEDPVFALGLSVLTIGCASHDLLAARM